MHRFLNSLTTRLQITTLLMSVVGIFFSWKSYVAVRDELPQVGELLQRDLELQLLCALIGQVLAWVIIHRLVITPVVILIERMRAYGDDKYDADVPYTEMQNQIGSFARKVKLFKDRVMYARRLEEEQNQLKLRAEADRSNLLRSLSGNLDQNVNRIVQQFGASTDTLKSNAQSLSTIAHDNSELVVSLIQQLVQSAHNMQKVSASAEQLTSGMREVSSQVTGASAIARDAVNETASANQAIGALSTATGRISEILILISNIAEQINLLALNASIEAARAGAAGKGFAVVASAIKELSLQTATATKEINQFVTHIAEQAETSATSLKGVSQTITKINTISGTVAEVIAAQDTATRHIAQHIQDSAHLASNSQHIAETFSVATRKIDGSASEMLKACTELSTQSSGLREEVKRFLSTLQQA